MRTGKFILFFIIFFPIFLFGSKTWQLYDDSQVAVVKITIDPLILEYIYRHSESDTLYPASIHFKNAWIDEKVDSVGFRIRGNTSRGSVKKSFKLSFNTFVPGRQFYGVDKLNLNAQQNDPSIVRSKICADLFQQIGLIASRAAHTAVYINGIYYGLYISVEHIDDEFLKNHFSDPAGNLWKCLWPADLTFRGNAPDDYYPYFNPERPYELITNTTENNYKPLARLIRIINNTPDNLFADSLEQVLIVPTFLKYLAMNVLVGSWDDYWFLKNNYYLYHEPGIDKFHWIPYDYDNTFGIDWFGVDWSAVDPYKFENMEKVQGQGYGPRPLAERVMKHPPYRNLYTHFLVFYRKNVYKLSLWEKHLDSLKNLIAPWAAIDTFRIQGYGFTMDDFHNSYTDMSYSNQHVKRGIKEFVNLRNLSLGRQLKWVTAGPIVYSLDWWPKSPRSTDSIHVIASVFGQAGLKSVTIQYRPGNLAQTEKIPMKFRPVEKTKRVENADRWEGVIHPIGSKGFGRFLVQAEDLQNQKMLFPGAAPILVQVSAADTIQIVMNEFLAKNNAVNKDKAGDYADWLELYNLTSKDVALGGFYLTDNPDNLTKWQFPSNVTIQANSYLLVWCDGETDDAELHASFNLGAAGEFIGLIAPDGVTIIDSLTFGPQQSNISFGRNPDGGRAWVNYTIPTPGKSNTTSTIAKEDSQPKEFILFQNYPNPFNQRTMIHYQLPERSFVRLVIYNLLGEQITELISATQDAGQVAIEWDGKDSAGLDVSSGVYFYQLSGGEFSQIHKMLLLR